MGKFNTSEEWGQLIVGFFEKVGTVEALAKKLTDANMTIRYNYSDPEFVLFADFTGGSVTVKPGDTESKADLELTLSADTAHQYYSGNLNAMVGLSTGKIKAKGAIVKAMSLVPAMGPLHALYNEYLEENDAYRQYKL